MGAFSDKMQKTAFNLIKRFGMNCIIKKRDRQEFNPDNGSYEYIEVEIEAECMVIKDNKNRYYGDNLSGDAIVRMLISSKEKVNEGDIILLDSKVYNLDKFKVIKINDIIVQDSIIMQKVDLGQ